MPNFQHYYWAANIRMLTFWVDPDKGKIAPDWLFFEKVIVCSLLCFGLPLVGPISKFTKNPVINHSLKIGKQFRRAFGINDLSIMAPFVGNHVFPPSLLDGAFAVWEAGGVHTLEDMYMGRLVRPNCT